jgi:hypothetical protein
MLMNQPCIFWPNADSQTGYGQKCRDGPGLTFRWTIGKLSVSRAMVDTRNGISKHPTQASQDPGDFNLVGNLVQKKRKNLPQQCIYAILSKDQGGRESMGQSRGFNPPGVRNLGRYHLIPAFCLSFCGLFVSLFFI